MDNDDSDDSDTPSAWFPAVRVQPPPEGIPLPNPHFIRINSSLAHVLRKSGAGRIIEGAVEGKGNWFEDIDGALCADDWQLLMLKEELMESEMWDYQFAGGSPRKAA